MNIRKTHADIVAAFEANPTAPENCGKLGSIWFKFVRDLAGQAAREKKDLAALLAAEEHFVNFGICNDLIDNPAQTAAKILDTQAQYPHVHIQLFSHWLLSEFNQIMQGNRRELVLREIALQQGQRKRLADEITICQQNRNALLLDKKQALFIDAHDDLMLEALRTRHSIAKGAYLAIDKKREHVKREQSIAANQAKIESFVSVVSPRESMMQLRSSLKLVEEYLTRLVTIEEDIAKKEATIVEIEKKQTSLSPLELENQITAIIDYLRDLMLLTAKRLHTGCCPILNHSEACISLTDLHAALDRVFEFDRGMLSNSRIALFGKPTVLLVPGNGNALYDWKYNQIIVPLQAPNAKSMASVATGLLEYRLDVDEEKQLINSYNQIPEMSVVKSLFTLKQNFVKDYLIWMTQEYAGFQVLPKNIRRWFVHEIAPDRNDIFTPVQYRGSSLSAEEFNTLLDESVLRCANPDLATEGDLWVAGVLSFQKGNFEKSAEFLKTLLAKSPTNAFAWYNLGHASVKSMHKQEAIAAFLEFCRLSPQTWWANVARDLIRHLQMH